jgi:heme-degrading monooxygenase HmoA
MILETALITVTPGREAEFINAVEFRGVEVLEQADGFLGLEISQGVERPNTILLALGWDTLEDHTVKFRGGPLFAAWRAVISPFFAEGTAPHVEHWEPRS